MCKVVPARLTDELHSSADLPAVQTFSLSLLSLLSFVEKKGHIAWERRDKLISKFYSFFSCFSFVLCFVCVCVCVRALVFRVSKLANGDRIDPPLNWEDVVEDATE